MVLVELLLDLIQICLVLPRGDRVDVGRYLGLDRSVFVVFEFRTYIRRVEDDGNAQTLLELVRRII